VRAVRITGPGRVEVVTAPAPAAAAGEVVVDVTWAAVCNTDRRLAARGTTAAVPGHEVAGELAGTPVGIHPDTGCGRCPACRDGRTNRCPAKVAIGIDRDGGLAGRVSVPEAHVVALDGVDPAVAPLLEPLACAVHAERRLPDAGETAVVVGAGAMGVLVMWVLQATGRRVAVRQRSAARAALAAELGADAVFGPDEEVPGGPPAAVVVTAPGADALAWALGAVADGGTVHAFAGSPGGALVDVNVVHYRHLDLVGGTGSGLADYRLAVELVRSGAVPLARLPRATTDLDGAVAALTTASTGRPLRTMIELTGEDR
jgi:threonine dehydrogenase-like Zn-dependent dehydrogenase